MKVHPGRSIRKFVSTALVSVALLAAVALPGQSAFALGTTTDLGTVGSPYSPPGIPGIGNIYFGHSGESFLDVYTFTLSAAAPASLFNAINITVDALGFSLDHGSFTTQLYDVTTAAIVYTATGVPFPIGPIIAWVNLIPPVPIASGDSFELRVSGTITGSSGGFYGGTFNISPAPVPEAETYVMLLAGLGLMGFVVRRRKRSS